MIAFEAMANSGELCTAISSCKKCDLYFSRRNVVCGLGDSSSRLMIIGEAPGAKEDETGKPFVGRSGKLLDGALQYAGILREHIYITNSVKCRPKIGRAPKVLEIKKCSDYLWQEIDQVNPRIIVPMGNAAINSVGHIFGINFGRVTEVQGSYLYFKGIYFAPQFHPAAILRDPKKLERFKDNFRSIAKLEGDLSRMEHENVVEEYRVKMI